MSSSVSTTPRGAPGTQDNPTWDAPKTNQVYPATGMSTYYTAGSRRSSSSPTSRDTSASPASKSRVRKPGSLTYKSSMSGMSDRSSGGSRRGSNVSSGSSTSRGKSRALPAATPSPQRNADKTGSATKSPVPVSPSSTSSGMRSTPSGTPRGGSSHSTISSCASSSLQEENNNTERLEPNFRTVVSIASDKDTSRVFSPPAGPGLAHHHSDGHVFPASIHQGARGDVLTATGQQAGTPRRHHKGVPSAVSPPASGQEVRRTDGVKGSDTLDNIDTRNHTPESARRDVTSGPQLDDYQANEVAIQSHTPKRYVLNGDTGPHTSPNTNQDISVNTSRVTADTKHTVANKAQDNRQYNDNNPSLSPPNQDKGIGISRGKRDSGGSQTDSGAKLNSRRNEGKRSGEYTVGGDTGGDERGADDMTSRRRPLPDPPSLGNHQMYENYTPGPPGAPSPPPPIPPHGINGYGHHSPRVNIGHNGVNSDSNMTPLLLHISPEAGHNGLGYTGMSHALDNHCYPHPAYTGTGFDSCPPYTGASSDISDSLDSDGSSLTTDSTGYRFHMDQQISTNMGVQNGDTRLGASPEHPFLIGQRDIMNPAEVKDTKIISSKGTVRGLKNLVRAGIATFAEKQDGIKNYRLSEAGKVVVYTTSVKIVRETYDRCIKVKKILQTHMIRYDERDIFMSKENQKEFIERMGSEQKDVPQIFADGQYIGSLEDMERMNESGELRTVFRPFKRMNRHASCSNCGGYQYTPCTVCHGSKKSQNRNYFMEEFCALRCTHCDENGLIRCDMCTDGEAITS